LESGYARKNGHKWLLTRLNVKHFGWFCFVAWFQQLQVPQGSTEVGIAEESYATK